MSLVKEIRLGIYGQLVRHAVKVKYRYFVFIRINHGMVYILLLILIGMEWQRHKNKFTVILRAQAAQIIQPLFLIRKEHLRRCFIRSVQPGGHGFPIEIFSPGKVIGRIQVKIITGKLTVSGMYDGPARHIIIYICGYAFVLCGICLKLRKRVL